MNLHLSTCCLVGLAIFELTSAPKLVAQDAVEAAETPATPEAKPYDTKPGVDKPLTAEERRVEEIRKKKLKADYELRHRLSNTVWNDLEIRAGAPGQVWMLRPPVPVGKREESAWFLNDDKGLPRVGSWEVKDGEILLKAMNGTLIGRGKYKDDEINGRFIDTDHHREFGQFKLREETKRNYRVLPLRGTNERRGE